MLPSPVGRPFHSLPRAISCVSPATLHVRSEFQGIELPCEFQPFRQRALSPSSSLRLSHESPRRAILDDRPILPFYFRSLAPTSTPSLNVNRLTSRFFSPIAKASPSSSPPILTHALTRTTCVSLYPVCYSSHIPT